MWAQFDGSYPRLERFLVIACLLTVTASAQAGQCERALNSPGASLPTDTNSKALATEAAARQRFLGCPADLLSAVVTASTNLGVKATADKFNVALKHYVEKPRTNQELKLAAQAVHIHQLLKDPNVSDRLSSGFQASWERSRCNALPLGVQDAATSAAPTLRNEIQRISLHAIRSAREVAGNLNPLPKLNCEMALKAWLEQSKH